MRSDPKEILLKTKRLLLREVRISDWPDIQTYASNPRVVRYVVWGPNTPSQTKEYVRLCQNRKRKKPRLHYELAVVERASGKLVGGAGLVVTNVGGREGSIGYCFNPSYWGMGYAAEGAAELIRLGFKSLHLHRIMAVCDAQNKASARVLEKAGMRREGHFRKNVYQKGKWRDTFSYALLREDWKGSGRLNEKI